MKPVLASGALLLALTTTSTAALAQVRIDTGIVEGVPARDPSITVYRGIPYAAPPVGVLRWRAPAPAKPWQGVRKTAKFGASCPQPRATEEMDEDCLFINVWTGANSGKERRPVMVWFHGGGFFAGTGSDPATDGTSLAKKGIILVTLNYRIGPLGFLASPGLSKESGHNASGNYGLLDEIAALKWVKRNIAAFGGDPDQVTVFGHSAGAGSVNFLSISPLATGLFKRVLAESQVRWPTDLELRYLSSSWRPKAGAEEAGTAYLKNLGARSLDEARAMPWKSLPNPGGETPDMTVYTGSTARPPQFRPVIDGYVLPRNYSQAFAAKSQARVEYAAGNNYDEGGASPPTAWAGLRARGDRGAINMGSPFPIVTLAAFEAAARKKFGARADEFLRLYPAATDDEAAAQNNEAIRDNSQVSTYLWSRQWKRDTGRSVHTYMWTHALAGPTRDTRGAFHGSEIHYVFNSLDEAKLPWADQDRQIAETMSSYWANYAKTGDPNGPGLPYWPGFDEKSRTVMLLGDSFGPEPIASDARFDFWQRFFATNQAW